MKPMKELFYEIGAMFIAGLVVAGTIVGILLLFSLIWLGVGFCIGFAVDLVFGFWLNPIIAAFAPGAPPSIPSLFALVFLVAGLLQAVKSR